MNDDIKIEVSAHDLAESFKSCPTCAELRKEECPDCDGEGEVYVGSSVPDDEGYQTCVLCGGSGKRLTNDDIRELRKNMWKGLGDLQASEYEISELRRELEEVKHQKALLDQFFYAWTMAESTRGCYSCTPEHDGRCHSRRPDGVCNCWRDELRKAENEILNRHKGES